MANSRVFCEFSLKKLHVFEKQVWRKKVSKEEFRFLSCNLKHKKNGFP